MYLSKDHLGLQVELGDIGLHTIQYPPKKKKVLLLVLIFYLFFVADFETALTLFYLLTLVAPNIYLQRMDV